MALWCARAAMLPELARLCDADRPVGLSAAARGRLAAWWAAYVRAAGHPEALTAAAHRAPHAPHPAWPFRPHSEGFVGKEKTHCSCVASWVRASCGVACFVERIVGVGRRLPRHCVAVRVESGCPCRRAAFTKAWPLPTLASHPAPCRSACLGSAQRCSQYCCPHLGGQHSNSTATADLFSSLPAPFPCANTRTHHPADPSPATTRRRRVPGSVA